ncbi:MAG: hypothetical protein IKT51_02670 [Phascolarctobacterium sp.]|nr:hypothetical protein [Phascolarctobacterium sp.]
MIGSSENSISYNGNGYATEFPFQFVILKKSDIKLFLVEADGTETLLTSDYFVDMSKNVVHYPGYSPGSEPPIDEQPSKLAEGQKLVLYRDVPITQETALDEHWPFNVIEGMADKLTIIAQQIAAANKRTFKLSLTLNNLSEINLQLPYAPGKSFAWNKDGTALELTDNPGAVIPLVRQEVEALEEYIAESQKEIAELVKELDSLTIGSIEELRDECRRLAEEALQAANANRGFLIGTPRPRAEWKSDYDINERVG